MNRIDQAFIDKKDRLLNVYFTAGYPNLDDTLSIAKALDEGGADLIEIGLPFSDPVADGPTIQASSTVALDNGMTLKKLFDQLATLREHVSVPVLLMGYINPVLQYGFEAFCAKCAEVGIDGLILPDLPMYEYEEMYQSVLEKYGLYNVFLITPQTSEERIQKIDSLSKGFIYMVSSASTTGAKSGISTEQISYFQKINSMGLKNKRLIGFGISDNESFSKACEFADGAIIGSAFIKLLEENSSSENIKNYIQQVKSPVS
ncbi:MAG: tryptophan synthase subunit alpha [Flammeovirgaceae bacterium]|nr:tryptophan synthase subunit alpha [Flammeovirgaceae bacterium]MBE62442.1 tryptophan synthase subunit alpha [Flammeovirgaceae bacterium]HCX23624.1 tryptophan synthase subunit alpha [Cytophagales bacterium]|tara:strand:+ start:2048 stop:2827 length:780 start_codon:yes stop_codon:yes gene_type:complete